MLSTILSQSWSESSGVIEVSFENNRWCEVESQRITIDCTDCLWSPQGRKVKIKSKIFQIMSKSARKKMQICQLNGNYIWCISQVISADFFIYLLQSLGQLGYFDWTIEWDVHCIANISIMILPPHTPSIKDGNI